MLSVIADVAGIAGFLLTIALLIRTESIRKELETQRADYIKLQKGIKEHLISLRANVIDDGLLNNKVISDLRTYLFTFRQRFQRLLSREDRKHLKVTLSMLEKSANDIDRNALCAELDYFVARFEKRERTQ